jgi:hypothetical protein
MSEEAVENNKTVEKSENEIVKKSENEIVEKSENEIVKKSENEIVEKSENENLNQFDFMSFLSNITNPKDTDSKKDVLNQMLGNIFQSILKNKVGNESKSDSEDSEDSEESEESESESVCSSEYSDLDAIFLIKEIDKEAVFTTTYSNAKSSLLSRFHHFLETNSSTSLRIDKSDDKIVAYDRNPNSLQPFQETLVFHCEFLRIEKQK